MITDDSRRRQRTPSNDEIPSLLEALAASGGSTAAFAREHGLAPWKLYKAQRTVGTARKRRRRKAAAAFVPIQIVEEQVPSGRPLEVVLLSGHRLLVPPGFDETTLRRLLEVLSSC